MALTERENYLRNASLEGAEWIPCNVAISGASWLEWGEEMEAVCLRHPIIFPHYRKGQWEQLRSRKRSHTVRDSWNCLWQFELEGLEGIVIEHPLSDWSALDSYQAPDPLETGDRGPVDWAETRKRITAARAEARLTSGSVSHGFIFMRLYYLRGFENLMMDFALDAPELQRLVDMVVWHNRRIVEAYLEMGIDLFQFADDLGTQTSSCVSPATFAKYITPAYKKMMQPCRQAGCHVALHSDGEIMEIMDELIEAGVTIINPQDLVNGIDNLAREVKGRICIRLDIDRQSIVPYGTPGEIRDLIEEEVRKLGSPQGGLEFIAGIYPPTPAENVDALCSALEEFRTWWWDGRGAYAPIER